ncbi:lysozyme inhibitor LprI family protein [Shinella sp. JR1-6]|uniref:lysozyme inhibitor LprI family protein n=1 Tax=Shinella sp. JR1-6 TaxID=2527671 RepID=UPI00102D612C|nr:lysozyme inhibitor LprI family protein [Shinella sp. JR1-6]
MVIRSCLLLATALLLLSAPMAAAQDGEPEVDCQNAQAQIEMNICAGRDYEAADEELNAAYKVTMAAARRMDEQAREMGEHYVGAVDALKRAQRAWIGYRDGQCELAGFEARGGSMEPMLVSGCLADLTRKRTAELKAVSEFSGN